MSVCLAPGDKRYSECKVNQSISHVKCHTMLSDTNSTAPSGGHGDGHNSSNPGYVIAAGVACAVVVVTVIAVLVYRFWRRRSGSVWLSKFHIKDHYLSMKDEDQSKKEERFIIGFSNPIMDNTDSLDGNNGGVKVLGYRPINTDTLSGERDYSLEYKFLFPRDKLVHGVEIGSGWFGKVFEGEANRIIPGVRKTKVIIKMLDEGSDPEMKARFMEEFEMFRCIDHKNVMGILGQATEIEPYLIIFHCTPLGNLKKFLISHRSGAKSMKERGLPLRISIDIASGLNCLHANNLYHSDLAARNCIVASDLSVKIGDYGISRCLYDEDYYTTSNSSQGSVPIRWVAPDSVVYNKDSGLTVKPPSVKGNVWSFGVTLWEVVEFGRQPYEELTNEDVIQSVIVDRLYQLPEPKQTGIVAGLLYEVMKKCWMEPTKRPSMQEVESTLMSLMSKQSISIIRSETRTQQTVTLNQVNSEQRNSFYQQPVAVVKPLQRESNTGIVTAVDIPSSWTRFETKEGIETEPSSLPLKTPTDEKATSDESGKGYPPRDDVQVTEICDDDIVPVTEIHSESPSNKGHNTDSPPVAESFLCKPPPVTYIGEPMDGLMEYENNISEGRHEEIKPSVEGSRIVEVKYCGPDSSQPSVIVESHLSGYVVLPNEIVRRKSSLRRANAKSKSKSVHYPANILDLRVVHRYCKEEDWEEGEQEEAEGVTSNDFPITCLEHDTDLSVDNKTSDAQDLSNEKINEEEDSIDISTFQSAKDSRDILVGNPGGKVSQGARNYDRSIDYEDQLTCPIVGERPTSPVEKKMKKASRRGKLKKHEDEWLISIEHESNKESNG